MFILHLKKAGVRLRPYQHMRCFILVLQMAEGPADCAVNINLQGFLQHPANSFEFPPCPSGRVWVEDPISSTSLSKLPHLWVVGLIPRTKLLPLSCTSICGKGTYLCSMCHLQHPSPGIHYTHMQLPIMSTPVEKRCHHCMGKMMSAYLSHDDDWCVTLGRASQTMPQLSVGTRHLSLPVPSPAVFWIDTQTCKDAPAGSPVWRIKDEDCGDLCVDHLLHSPHILQLLENLQKVINLDIVELHSIAPGEL